MQINELVKNEIDNHIDLKYLKFHSKLVPNIDNIKGVRIPILKNIARQISKMDRIIDYLDDPIFNSYEELTIYGLVLGYTELNFDDYLKYLKKYVSYIDNWATCDTVVSNLKFTKQILEKVYPFLLELIYSKKEFEVRFAVVMFLNYYIIDDYIDTILLNMTKITHDGYYVKMAIAWLISICYIKYKEKTLIFLKTNKIDIWIYQKSLQKIIELRRITCEEKREIRMLKK